MNKNDITPNMSIISSDKQTELAKFSYQIINSFDIDDKVRSERTMQWEFHPMKVIE